MNTARDYSSAAASDNTLKDYAKDWAQFACWRRVRGAGPLPPSPGLVGLYIADLVAPQGQGLTKPPALSWSEGILDYDTGRAEIIDIARHNSCAMMQRRGGNHQIGTTMPDLCRQTPPDARILCPESKQPVREQQHRATQPSAKITGKSWIARFLLSDTTLDFAKRNNTQEKVLFRFSAQPGFHAWRPVRAAYRGDDICIENIHQKLTSRGATCARGTSSPGNAIK